MDPPDRTHLENCGWCWKDGGAPSKLFGLESVENRQKADINCTAEILLGSIAGEEHYWSCHNYQHTVREALFNIRTVYLKKCVLHLKCFEINKTI